MRREYEPWNPGETALVVVGQAAAICDDYRDQGYILTLRQLYYRFVAADLFPEDRKWIQNARGKWVRDPKGTKNAEPNYKWLGLIINKARMAGLLDWSMFEDRTRNLETRSHWDDPAGVIQAAARSFHRDLWADQPFRVEVWVEKEALAGIVDLVASRWDCPWFSCRGYVSQSELWSAGQRLGRYLENQQRVVVLHLGDHDPSGIDMTRDMAERLRLFITRDWAAANRYGPIRDEADRLDAIECMCADLANAIDPNDEEDITSWEDLVDVRRIALNMDQVREWDPPPNPAKLSDSRSTKYIREYGDESWELDALSPETLDGLIESHIIDVMDRDRFNAAIDVQEGQRELLTATSDRWPEVQEFIEGQE